MAMFCDLDDDCTDHSRSRHDTPSTQPDARQSTLPDQLKLGTTVGSGAIDGAGRRESVQVESAQSNQLAAALTCYPVALSLSSLLDLNDLHSLASTCRSVHESLTQYAQQLKAHSLRCINEGIPKLTDILAAETEEIPIDMPVYNTVQSTGGAALEPHPRPAAAVSPWRRARAEGLYASMGVTSKIRSCARDLVAPCRRCGTVICRNCAAKSPSNGMLKDRFRRLCKTCLDAPVVAHLQPLAGSQDLGEGSTSSASSIRSERSLSGSSTGSAPVLEGGDRGLEYQPTFTSAAVLRGPCTCESRGVFLCNPCGQNLRATDTTYKRVWTWRSRYSTHIGGGLGTGLGEGNQGQKCGRGEDCLETGGKSVCWVEIDCSEGKANDGSLEHEGSRSSRMGTPDFINKPGYFQQEIEGIGGVVKKKVKKRVKVGATVWEYDDERESGKYLEREAKGIARSWCGWCGRLCPGEADREEGYLDMLGMNV